jgi:hypothetical protein
MGTLYQNGQQLFNIAPLKNTYSNDPNSAASAKTVYDLKENSMVFDYTHGTTVSSGSITAGDSISYTATASGLISLQNMYAGSVDTSTTTGMPFVRLSINGYEIFNTQGFSRANVRASGCVLPVNTGDVVTISVLNKDLTNYSLSFVSKI